MHILVLSDAEMAAEFQQKFSGASTDTRFTFISSYQELGKKAAEADVVFDFLLADNPEQFKLYASLDLPVFCHSVQIQLASLVVGLTNHKCTLIGFNGLPTLFDRPLLEVSLLDRSKESLLREVCEKLNTEFQLVEDRVGLVTPRIICMIINEACYTLQEGTASVVDIDLGMQLGTNYPKGPLAWADEIGISNVYNTLKALYNDTREERYKICPLLKTKFLRNEKFYS